MRQYRVTSADHEDLAEIWSYIATDSPTAADRLIASIVDRFEKLARFPEMGRLREDLGRSLRSLPIGRYLIFYEIVDDGIDILRILSAYRDIDTILGVENA